jgi:protein SCO1/2
MNKLPFVATITLAVVWLSCKKQDQQPVDLVTFPLRGEVVAIDTAKLRITVSHEEIPDYMMAMIMPFKVKNPDLLRSVEVGDTIQGTLAVSRTESWLETFTVVGRGEPRQTLSPEEVQMHRLFAIGDVLPDETLINQNERKIKFSDFRGKVVAFTFIYTRCPLPEYCILMSNNFSKVQRALAADKALDGKWHLLTISFDPKFDKPKVLRSYAGSYKADLTTWSFLTDPDTAGRTVLRISNGLDLTYADDEGLIQHNLRTAILDAQGRLVKIIKGNEWKAEELVEIIRKTIRG